MTPQECANMKTDIAVNKEKMEAIDGRVDRLEERLCAKLDEFNDFLKKWAVIALLMIAFGDKALPIIEKLLLP